MSEQANRGEWRAVWDRAGVRTGPKAPNKADRHTIQRENKVERKKNGVDGELSED